MTTRWREGYTTWKKAEKAGVVGKTVIWSEDDIYIDNTLGRVRDALGPAYPMDLAVAYTIATIGRDAKITVDEMVNEYTKRATLLMSQKIGWDRLPRPEQESCGHDEINGWTYSLRIPNVNDGVLQGMLGSTVDIESVPDEILHLARFRLTNEDAEKFSNYIDVLLSEKFSPLLKWLRETYEFDTIDENYTTHDVFTYSKTKGVCAWKDDDEKVCSHHSPEFDEDWWMILRSDGTPYRAWHTGREASCNNSWNDKQFCNTYTGYRHKDENLFKGPSWNAEFVGDKSRIMRFNTVARDLIERLDEKEVKSQIRKSLNRITNWTTYRRGIARSLVNFDLNGYERRGKHTTYTWKDWDWLDKIHTAIKYTNSKNRQLGEKACAKCFAEDYTDENGSHTCKDSCNEGWIYEKYQSKHYYGHEISKFRWIPVAGNNGNEHWKLYAFNTFPNFNVLFNTLQEASVARKLMAASLLKVNGFKLNADYDENTDKRVPITEDDLKEGGGLKILSVIPYETNWITLPAEIDPEEYATTKDIFMGCAVGNPKYFDEYSEHIANGGQIYVKRKNKTYGYDMSIQKPKIIEKKDREVVINADE